MKYTSISNANDIDKIVFAWFISITATWDVNSAVEMSQLRPVSAWIREPNLLHARRTPWLCPRCGCLNWWIRTYVLNAKIYFFFSRYTLLGFPFCDQNIANAINYPWPWTIKTSGIQFNSWQDYITKGPRHPLLLRFITMTQHLCVYIVFAHAIKLQMLQIKNVRVLTVCIRPLGTTCRN